MTPKVSAARRHRVWPAVILGLFVAHAGCGLDGVEIPELDGPSELATAVALTASPDLITADGFSTSLITATVRGPNGEPIAGREIFFAIADASGFFADIGELRSTTTGTGVGTGVTVRTNAQGVAAVVYEAPARTDATANQTVLVSARPVGTDANAALYRVVRIELRSAEPRLFPQNPAGNTPPTCNFTVQTVGKSDCVGGVGTIPVCAVPINTSVLFQSTAFDVGGTIIRYFWSFGNGKTADHPDTSTSYSIPGTYFVDHLVTDNNGGQSACGTSIIAF
jgi:PKD domain-containing protein